MAQACAASSAWARSAMRSSVSSMPTESRSRSGGHGVSGPSTEARCSIRLSTPPSEVARFQICTRAAVLILAAFHADGQHAAEAAMHLARSDGVAGEILHPRIKHMGHIRVTDEMLGDLL